MTLLAPPRAPTGNLRRKQAGKVEINRLQAAAGAVSAGGRPAGLTAESAKARRLNSARQRQENKRQEAADRRRVGSGGGPPKIIGPRRSAPSFPNSRTSLLVSAEHAALALTRLRAQEWCR
jgi:hypothetical protein